jgi:hypothetical protein
VSDIFREVEEDVRREKAEKFWKAYGNYIMAVGVILFLGIGAWQLWSRHEQQEREKTAAVFMAAQRITTPQNAAGAFADMAASAPKGYGKVARLSQAGAMFAAGQQKEAVALFKDIAAGDSGTIGAVARLRAAWAQADTLSRGDMTDWLAPLDKPGSAWRPNAREVLAYADYRALDMKSAREKYAALAIDPEAPDALRARAKAMSVFLAGGGAVTYGTVPPEVVPMPLGAPAAPASAAPAPAAPTAVTPAPAK